MREYRRLGLLLTMPYQFSSCYFGSVFSTEKPLTTVLALSTCPPRQTDHP